MSLFRRKSFLFIFIFFIFLILFIGMTYPFVFKVNTCITGFFSSDENIAPLWDSWRIKYSLFHNLQFAHTPMIAHPFGVDLYGSGYFSYLFQALLYVLSIFTTPELTYNIIIMLNLFLSSVFTFMLFYYLTKDRKSAFFCAIIFTFCPYQFARAWQHLSLTYNQWIPLALLSIVLLKENYTKKNVFLFLISLLLILSFDWTLMYLAAVSIIISFVFILFYNWKAKFFSQVRLFKKDIIFLRKTVIIGLIPIILLLPQFLPIIKNSLKFSSTTPASAHNSYRRAFEDLFSQSARPLSYFLPATVHPVFGKFTEQFIGSPLYGISFTEHALYLGWIPLILAFVAVKVWKKRRKEIKDLGTVPFGDSPFAKEDFYIGFFVFLAIVAWLFSQPPWWNIFGFKIYMPSFFMYKILPMFRAYCRFGIVVMLAVAVLAGFGLKFILERFKSRKVRIAVTSLFCGLVLFEFWNWPPYKVIDVSKVPAVYYWLKEYPGDFAIAEYPLDADSPNEMYKFYQTVHEKKIINGTIPGTYANKFAQAIRRLSQPETAAALKRMGVEYTLVHRQGYKDTGLVDDSEELNKISQNPGLKLIKSFPEQECPQNDIACVQKTGQIDVYEVQAESVKPKAK